MATSDSANAGVGVVAPATFVTDSPNETSLPPNQSLVLVMLLSAPTAPGTYQFSFRVTIDGARLPFAALADSLLLDSAAHAWTGDACARPEMQTQIPTGSADSYICPA